MKALTKIVMVIMVAFLSNNINAQNINKITKVTIKVPVQCGMCKAKIEKNIGYEKGVKEVIVDLTTKEVTIEYIPEKTNPENLRLAISKLGYDADDVAADTKAYNKLPLCCKKP